MLHHVFKAFARNQTLNAHVAKHVSKVAPIAGAAAAAMIAPHIHKVAPHVVKTFARMGSMATGPANGHKVAASMVRKWSGL
jgi:hypothetical protein